MLKSNLQIIQQLVDSFALLARAGGGGSSGGGGGAGIIALPLVIIGAIYAWWKRRQTIKKAKQNLAVAVSSDPTWETAVKSASDIFYKYQQDWSSFNFESMKTYLAPKYFEHISLMLEALRQMNRQNRMSNVRLGSATIFNVNDSPVDTLDNFDIEMKAQAHDELVDLSQNVVLFVDDSVFTEIWNFDREGNSWLLQSINQSDMSSAIEKGLITLSQSQARSANEAQMRLFARDNEFFYNADFGWLLLPTRGELFTLANFGRSDINFHVIGKYHDVLVQFYQYMPVVEDKRRFMDYLKAWYKPAYRYDAYIVGQAVLPKTYGNIIVRRKESVSLPFRPTGMKKVSLEAVDFNKFFSVYATDVEQATSLELLNPAYMESLLKIPFKVSIEIVDNILYLYSTDDKADFDTMLRLLKNAFEEMKM